MVGEIAAGTPAVSGEDIACIRCGYNLRGLDASGRCPECGEAAAQSVRGRGIATADRPWARRLALGAFITGACPTGLIATRFVVPQLLRDSSVAVHIATAVIFAIGVAGVWLITGREPGGPYFDEAKWTRRVLRVLGSAALVGIPFGLLELWWHPAAQILGMSVAALQSDMAMVAFPAALLALMLVQPRYQAILARRFPSRRLTLHGHLTMLALPCAVALYAGIFVFVVVLATPPRIAVWAIVLNVVALALFAWPGVYSVIWGIKLRRLNRGAAAR